MRIPTSTHRGVDLFGGQVFDRRDALQVRPVLCVHVGFRYLVCEWAARKVDDAGSTRLCNTILHVLHAKAHAHAHAHDHASKLANYMRAKSLNKTEVEEGLNGSR